MDQWKTTTKRFSPRWKTHPRSHRELALGMIAVRVCPECQHDTTLHFYEKKYPELGFCQVRTCDCSCSWLREINLNG